jgi:hypothetical protein
MTRNHAISMLIAGFALAIVPLSANDFFAGTVSIHKPSVTSVRPAGLEDLADNWVWDGPVGNDPTAGTNSTPSAGTDISASI